MFSRLFFYGAALCLCLSALLWGFNLSLSQTAVATQVKKTLNQKIPNVEIDFSSPQLYWSWQGFAVRAQDFSMVLDDNNRLHAPQVYFYTAQSGLRVFLNSPTINFQRTTSGGNLALPVAGDDWELAATDAFIRLGDSSTQISATLTAADFSLRHEKNRFYLDLSDTESYGGLKAIAEFEKGKTTSETLSVHGNLYLSVPQLPAMPKLLSGLSITGWEAAAITLWANVGDEIRLTVAGVAKEPQHAIGRAKALTWRADGVSDKNGDIRLSVIGVAEEPQHEIGRAKMLAWRVGGIRDKYGALRLTTAGVALKLEHADAAAATLHWKAAVSSADSSVAFKSNAWGASFAALPNVLPADFSLRGIWRGQQDGEWRLQEGLLTAAVAGTALSARLTLTGKDNTLLSVRISGVADSVAVTSVMHYVPIDEVQEWMAYALQGGVLSQLSFGINASVAALKEKLKGLSLKSSFVGGRIETADDWPNVSNLAGALLLQDGNLHIAGEGAVGGIYIPDFTANIADMASSFPPTLRLNISVALAPLANYGKVAETIPPIKKDIKNFNDNYRFDGQGALSLSVGMPLDKPENTQVNAVLLIGNGNLLIPDKALPSLNIVSGTAFINNRQMSGMLTGFLREEPLSVLFSSDSFTMASAIEMKTVISLLGFSALCKNCADGKIAFTVSVNPLQTVVTSPLIGVSVTLPLPFGKARDDISPLSVVFYAGGVSAFLLNADNTVRVLYQNGGGDIAINDSSAPPQDDVFNIHGAFSGFDADNFITAYSGLMIADENHDANITSQNGIGGISLILSDVMFLGERQTVLAIQSPSPTGNYRRIQLSTKPMAGDIVIGKNFLAGNFEHANLSFGDGDLDWESMTLALTVERLMKDDILLGRATLFGHPTNDAWQLQTLAIVTGDSRLFVTGAVIASLTTLSVLLTTSDLAAFLSGFGLDNFISAGDMAITGNIFWPQLSTPWMIEDLRGMLHLEMNNVQYLKAGSDISRFLSILSPASLFNLGFTELGKPGGQSYYIAGAMNISDGFVSTKEIHMTSNDIDIVLRGQTDMRHRQHDLAGRVRPGKRYMGAGSTVSLGATLAGATAFNPPLFLAAFLLGKVFEKPLSEIGAYNYTISGSWDEPVYTEVGIEK